MLKGPTHYEAITFINIYAFNNRALKYMSKHFELRGKIDNAILEVEDFSTPLLTMDRTSRKSTNI